MLLADVAQQAPLRFSPEAYVQTEVVRLAALADLSVLPPALAADVADLAVLRVRAGRRTLSIGTAQLTSRIAALAPALKPWLIDQHAVVRVRYEPSPRPGASQGSCAEVTQPLAKGAVITAGALSPASCPAVSPHGLWFDAHAGTVKAPRPLSVGEVVRAPPTSNLAEVAPGDALLWEAQVGPVVVQRPVVALQPGRLGGRLFARTSDGAVVTIPPPRQAP